MYEKFYDIALKSLQMQIENEPGSPKIFGLKFHLVFASLAMGKINQAYNLIRFWLMKYDLEEDEIKNVLEPNELAMLKFQDHYGTKGATAMGVIFELMPEKPVDWDGFLEDYTGFGMHLATFIPGLIAIKIKEIQDLKKLAENFQSHNSCSLKKLSSENPGVSKSILMIYAGSVDEKELKENIDNQLQELAILVKLGRQSMFLSARRALLCFLCCHDLSLLFVGFFFVICGILLGYL